MNKNDFIEAMQEVERDKRKKRKQTAFDVFIGMLIAVCFTGLLFLFGVITYCYITSSQPLALCIVLAVLVAIPLIIVPTYYVVKGIRK
jgi:uncharacterized protein with PQ loop repeat